MSPCQPPNHELRGFVDGATARELMGAAAEVVSAEPKLRSEVRGRMMIDGVVVFGL